MPEHGPPPSGAGAFWARGDLFDAATLEGLCHKARVSPRGDLDRAAQILAVAAGQIIERLGVPAPPAAVRNWAKRVLRHCEALRDELGRKPADQEHAHAHLALAAVGVVDSRTPEAVALILAAEAVAPATEGDNVFAGVLDALRRVPAALEVLATAASAVEAQAARSVTRGRRNQAEWRAFVRDACHAYETATGRRAGTSKDKENAPAGPALRFVTAAAEVVRARNMALPPLSDDFADAGIAAWARGKKLTRKSP